MSEQSLVIYDRVRISINPLKGAHKLRRHSLKRM